MASPTKYYQVRILAIHRESEKDSGSIPGTGSYAQRPDPDPDPPDKKITSGLGDQLVTGSPLEGDHARLLKELGDALAAFHAALKAIGLRFPPPAVDQYVATLLGGFGASETQLDGVLPNLKNFGPARKLAFL